MARSTTQPLCPRDQTELEFCGSDVGGEGRFFPAGWWCELCGLFQVEDRDDPMEYQPDNPAHAALRGRMGFGPFGAKHDS